MTASRQSSVTRRDAWGRARNDPRGEGIPAAISIDLIRDQHWPNESSPLLLAKAGQKPYNILTFQALFRIHPSQGVDSVRGMHLRSNGPGRGSFGPSIEENPAMTIITAVIACGLLSV